MGWLADPLGVTPAPIGRGGVGWREASQRGGRHLGWRLVRVVTAARCLGDPGGPEGPGRHRERRPLRNLPPCLDSSSGEVKVRSRWHILELFYFSLEKAVCTREGDSAEETLAVDGKALFVFQCWFCFPGSSFIHQSCFRGFILAPEAIKAQGHRGSKSSRSQGKYFQMLIDSPPASAVEF